MFLSEIKRASSRKSFKLMILLVSIICLLSIWDILKGGLNDRDMLILLFQNLYFLIQILFLIF